MTTCCELSLNSREVQWCDVNYREIVDPNGSSVVNPAGLPPAIVTILCLPHVLVHLTALYGDDSESGLVIPSLGQAKLHSWL